MAMQYPDRLEIVPFEGPLDAVIRPPGSKSITNRALLVAALAQGRSRIDGALVADDTDAMAACARGLGADIVRTGTTFEVVGLGGVVPSDRSRLDAGESGTTARFVAAALLLSADAVELDALEPMRRRPMGPTIDALRSLGARVDELGEPGHLPIAVTGSTDRPEEMPELTLPASESSQFASGLLIVGACLPLGLCLRLDGPVVSRPYLDMTVAVMRRFGALVECPDDRTWIVHPGGYDGTTIEVEPDASGASYFFAAAAIVGGRVTVAGLGRESVQGDLGFVDVLERMGAVVEREDSSTTVRSAGLRGVEVDMSDISDTAQTLAAVAVFASTPTSVTGIGFIRAKETDRIGAIVSELRRLGVDVKEEADGFVIAPSNPHGAEVETHGDHRMAMSLTLVGSRVPGVVVLEPACVAKTFPTYFELFESMRTGGNG